MRSEMEEARSLLIKQAEDKKDEIIKELTKEHVKKYQDIKAYYMDITTNNIGTIKKLKSEISGFQKCKTILIQRRISIKLNYNKSKKKAEN